MQGGSSFFSASLLSMAHPSKTENLPQGTLLRMPYGRVGSGKARKPYSAISAIATEPR